MNNKLFANSGTSLVAISNSKQKIDKVSIADAYRLLVNFFYTNYQFSNSQQLSNLYIDSLLNYYKNAKEVILFSVIVVPSMDSIINSNYMYHVKKQSVESKYKELVDHIIQKKIFVAIVNLAMTHLNTQYHEICIKYAETTNAHEAFARRLSELTEPHNYNINILLPADLSNEHKINAFLRKLECC